MFKPCDQKLFLKILAWQIVKSRMKQYRETAKDCEDPDNEESEGEGGFGGNALTAALGNIAFIGHLHENKIISKLPYKQPLDF